MERCSDDALSYMGAPHGQIQSYRDNGRVPTLSEMVAWGSDSSVPFKCNEFREECVDEDVDPQETGIDTTGQAPLQNLPYEYAWERSMLDPLHVLGHQYDNCKAPLMGYVPPNAPKNNYETAVKIVKMEKRYLGRFEELYIDPRPPRGGTPIEFILSEKVQKDVDER
eukprot:Nk52_evm1s1318 gene=Nk52_evmTU1s1318